MHFFCWYMAASASETVRMILPLVSSTSSNAEHTDPELLHFLLQLADKLVHSRHILSKTERLKPAA